MDDTVISVAGQVRFLLEGVERRRVRSLRDSASLPPAGTPRPPPEAGPPGLCAGINPFYPPGSLGGHTPVPDYAPQVVPGVVVLRAGTGPGVFMVHGRNGVDVTQPLIAPTLAPCHVCALVYDDDAFRCATVPELARLFNKRLLAECDRLGRPLGEPGCERLAVTGCSLGCPIAHEMVLQLQDSGLEPRLVLFAQDASWPPLAPWPSGSAAPEMPQRPKGCEWLGGEVETALLTARASGAVEWAEREVAKGAAPENLDADDVLMRVYWEHARHFGMSFNSFNEFVAKAGRSSERLRKVINKHTPSRTFSGRVEFVMTRAAWADVPCLFGRD